MTHLTVPRRVERILASLGSSDEFRQDVLGDLEEEFSIRVAWDSPAAARRWYYRESLRVAPHLLRDWWGRLGWRDVLRLTGVFIGCAVGILAVQSITVALFGKLADLLGMSPLQLLASRTTRLSALFTANAVVSLATGYFAASIGSRARIPTALAMSSLWGVFISIAWVRYPGMAPTWFSALNMFTVVSCIALGGVLRAVRPVRNARGPSLRSG